MASPRQGKYPFVLVATAQTFPCAAAPGLGGPAAALSLPGCWPCPRGHQAGPLLLGLWLGQVLVQDSSGVSPNLSATDLKLLSVGVSARAKLQHVWVGNLLEWRGF